MGKAKTGTKATQEPVYQDVFEMEKKKAELKRARYQDHYDISVDQMTGLSKWLVTSIFTVNSGGLLTILNLAEKVQYAVMAGSCFVLGLILCLLSGAANQEVYSRATEPISDMIDYWGEVQITGLQDTEKHEAIADSFKSINKWMWVGPTLGWIAGLAFVGGSITIAFGL